MASVRNLRRSSVVLGLTVLACGSMSLPAMAHAGGPMQFFTGGINGTDCNTVNPITIKMACYGAIHPGETGHPLRGQTLAVHQLFPPSPGSLGQTGNDSEIG